MFSLGGRGGFYSSYKNKSWWLCLFLPITRGKAEGEAALWWRSPCCEASFQLMSGTNALPPGRLENTNTSSTVRIWIQNITRESFVKTSTTYLTLISDMKSVQSTVHDCLLLVHCKLLVVAFVRLFYANPVFLTVWSHLRKTVVTEQFSFLLFSPFFRLLKVIKLMVKYLVCLLSRKIPFIDRLLLLNGG